MILLKHFDFVCGERMANFPKALNIDSKRRYSDVVEKQKNVRNFLNNNMTILEFSKLELMPIWKSIVCK